jgi:hypothetical protein
MNMKRVSKYKSSIGLNAWIEKIVNDSSDLCI